MGAVLFSIFINDLEKAILSSGLQMTPNMGNHGYTQEQGCLPKELSLKEWPDKNSMKFNQDKCKVLQPGKETIQAATIQNSSRLMG